MVDYCWFGDVKKFWNHVFDKFEVGDKVTVRIGKEDFKGKIIFTQKDSNLYGVEITHGWRKGMSKTCHKGELRRV